MRIILSRKGFDSSAGGIPSPILPDGRPYSLPIPDVQSPIRYGDIDYDGINLGDLLFSMTGDPEWSRRGAHLDPDLRPGSLPRLPGWRPLLGQSGSAQGHLQNEGVGRGDLFLFFGSFRRVRMEGGRYRSSGAPLHLIWGWMQIAEVCRVDDLPKDALHWARYHPHFAYGRDSANTLYLATERFSLDGRPTRLPGAGCFRHLDERRVLTVPGSKRQTRWQLPACFTPGEGRPGLSFHRNPNRWIRMGNSCVLDSAFRGQEFVLSTGGDRAPLEWVAGLLETI